MDFFCLQNLKKTAGGISKTENPPFSFSDFVKFFPQFSELSEDIFNMFLTAANAIINISDYEELWFFAMCFFIAHHVKMYEREKTLGEAAGVIASKSVGSVSVSYDTGGILGEFEGWGIFKETEYGRQFLTIARTAKKGGFYVC